VNETLHGLHAQNVQADGLQLHGLRAKSAQADGLKLRGLRAKSVRANDLGVRKADVRETVHGLHAKADTHETVHGLHAEDARENEAVHGLLEQVHDRHANPHVEHLLS